MSMRSARVLVALVGIVLPYAARIPRGADWLRQYTAVELSAWLFLGAFNGIAWGSIFAISFAYRRPSSLLAPALPGFGFLAWAHGSLDLAADAQSALGLVFIPIYALAPIAVGSVIGLVLDRRARRSSAG